MKQGTIGKSADVPVRQAALRRSREHRPKTTPDDSSSPSPIGRSLTSRQRGRLRRQVPPSEAGSRGQRRGADFPAWSPSRQQHSGPGAPSPETCRTAERSQATRGRQSRQRSPWSPRSGLRTGRPALPMTVRSRPPVSLPRRPCERGHPTHSGGRDVRGPPRPPGRAPTGRRSTLRRASTACLRTGAARAEGSPPMVEAGHAIASGPPRPTRFLDTGRRPHHRPWQLRDRHWAHHPIHDAAPTPHGRTGRLRVKNAGSCGAWRRSRTSITTITALPDRVGP